MRTLVRIAAFIRRIVWWVLRPRTIGAQVIVERDDGRVMLVNHSYERKVLRLPGGGAKRSESLAECAARELREETGLVLPAGPESLELLGIYSGQEGQQSAVLAVFIAAGGSWKGEMRLSAELDSADFFDPSDPPDLASPATHRRLCEFREGNRGLAGRW